MLLFENEKKVNKASKLVKVVLFFFYTSPTETLFLKKVCTDTYCQIPRETERALMFPKQSQGKHQDSSH